ncbi:DUF512 domain-containing protein [Thermoanaerobacterium sp. DL9XJH110]|uniref:DUF512 domain-containing protein n=1 Tax=Thermoanaerobacterium sp. DL9XJH110 TaxID=3386643 RepID=UPI003BB7CD74
MGKKAVIKAVQPHSIAASIGLSPGDEILRINGRCFGDFLDYKYLITEEKLDVEVKNKNGAVNHFTVHKNFDENLGIEFENPLMDDIIRCRNRCIFCFVDQMPRGLRKSLYVKDDDYRLSIVNGTFISLTNLSQKDFHRIVTLGLSPLYISVHATSAEVRRFMLKNPRSGEILEKLKFLADHGISVHTQLVLCPGINDGKVLDQTLEDLAALWPHVQSIAVVPVGLTKFRKGLFPLRPYTRQEASRILDRVEHFQKKCLARYGTRLAFAADEFYIKADRAIPPYETYEKFYQLENGIGLMALLKKELEYCMRRLPPGLAVRRRVAVATGVSAYKFLIKELSPLNAVKNLEYKIYPIVNDFFGHTVTVAGLISGRDLIGQLKGKDLGDILLIPEVMLKDRRFFLDDVTVKDVKDSLGVKVCVVGINGTDFVRKMLGTNWRKGK